MKYRMLTNDELSHLEEELKHFLIVHGIHAEEWEEMNRSQPEKAIELVGLFSDTVLQKVYEKLRFIEHRTKSSCMVFYLKDDAIEMISINGKSDAIDLSTPEGIHECLTHRAEELTFFQSSKSYAKPREEEIHEMLMQGCLNSSEAFWSQLKKGLSTS